MLVGVWGLEVVYEKLRKIINDAIGDINWRRIDAKDWQMVAGRWSSLGSVWGWLYE